MHFLHYLWDQHVVVLAVLQSVHLSRAHVAFVKYQKLWEALPEQSVKCSPSAHSQQKQIHQFVFCSIHLLANSISQWSGIYYKRKPKAHNCCKEKQALD